MITAGLYNAVVCIQHGVSARFCKGHVNEGNLMPLGWARSCTADSYGSSGQVDLDQGLEMVRYEQVKEPIKNLLCTIRAQEVKAVDSKALKIMLWLRTFILL